MRFEKRYTTTVNIADPYTAGSDIDRFLLGNLSRTYTGKCFKGAFIIQVLRVTERGPITIKKQDLSGTATIDVEFVADVSVLGAWEAIGVEIVSATPTAIRGFSESEGTAAVMFVPTAAARVLRATDRVAARVVQIAYPPLQPGAVIVANLLTAERQAPVYSVETPLTKAEAERLAPLTAQVRELLARRTALLADRRADVFRFERLLYSYRVPDGAGSASDAISEGDAGSSDATSSWDGPRGYPLPESVAAVNILDYVASRAAGSAAAAGGPPEVWSRDLRIWRSSPLVTRVVGERPASWGEPVAAAAFQACLGFLKSVYDSLRAVELMAEMYAEDGAPDGRYRVLWEVMRQAQLDPDLARHHE